MSTVEDLSALELFALLSGRVITTSAEFGELKPFIEQLLNTDLTLQRKPFRLKVYHLCVLQCLYSKPFAGYIRKLSSRSDLSTIVFNNVKQIVARLHRISHYASKLEKSQGEATAASIMIAQYWYHITQDKEYRMPNWVHMEEEEGGPTPLITRMRNFVYSLVEVEQDKIDPLDFDLSLSPNCFHVSMIQGLNPDHKFLDDANEPILDISDQLDNLPSTVEATPQSVVEDTPKTPVVSQPPASIPTPKKMGVGFTDTSALTGENLKQVRASLEARGVTTPVKPTSALKPSSGFYVPTPKKVDETKLFYKLLSREARTFQRMEMIEDKRIEGFETPILPYSGPDKYKVTGNVVRHWNRDLPSLPDQSGLELGVTSKDTYVIPPSIVKCFNEGIMINDDIWQALCIMWNNDNWARLTGRYDENIFFLFVFSLDPNLPAAKKASALQMAWYHFTACNINPLADDFAEECEIVASLASLEPTEYPFGKSAQIKAVTDRRVIQELRVLVDETIKMHQAMIQAQANTVKVLHSSVNEIAKAMSQNTRGLTHAEIAAAYGNQDVGGYNPFRRTRSASKGSGKSTHSSYVGTHTQQASATGSELTTYTRSQQSLDPGRTKYYYGKKKDRRSRSRAKDTTGSSK